MTYIKNPTTVYDLNFITQSTQTINASTVVIDGKTWTVEANATLNGTITNGVGLVATPSLTSVNCGITIPLSSISSVLKRRIRIWLYTTISNAQVTNGSENYMLLQYRYDGLTAFNGTNRIATGFHNQGYATQGTYFTNFQLGSNTIATQITTGSGDDTWMMEIDNTSYQHYSGSYSSGFPAPMAMRERYNNTNGVFGTNFVRSAARIELFFFAGGNTSMTATVKRLMVQSI